MKYISVRQALSLLSAERRPKLVQAARFYRPCLHVGAYRRLANSSEGPNNECREREAAFKEELQLANEELSEKDLSIPGAPEEICIRICRLGTGVI